MEVYNETVGIEKLVSGGFVVWHSLRGTSAEQAESRLEYAATDLDDLISLVRRIFTQRRRRTKKKAKGAAAPTTPAAPASPPPIQGRNRTTAAEIPVGGATAVVTGGTLDFGADFTLEEREKLSH